jgi:predicted nucleotidyltransferase
MGSQSKQSALEIHIDAALANDGAVVVALRRAFPNVLAIYAFGSRIQGMAREDSDLDLAVLVAGYAEPLQLWEQANQLTEILGCAVDLLDLRAASTVMQYQVLTQGLRLWASEPAAGLFECFALSEKIRLDADRAGLIADIENNGRVYG